MKISKLSIALMVIVTLGAGTAFAGFWNGIGTGTGTCIKVQSPEEPSFSPFAEWSGIASGTSSFGGGWSDPVTGQSGAFWGQWKQKTPPGQFPEVYEASGTWYRYNNGLEEMGTFTMIFDAWQTGNASGKWQTFSNHGWQGQGELTGDDPNIPPVDE